MNELPLFPLRTVLFPGGLLPLRIFEPRYVDMISRCMREGGSFGVLLIVEGGETGPVAGLAPIGCSARVLDFQQLPDGLLGILCRGERRFRLLSRETQPDGLHVGAIEWLPQPARQALPDEHRALGGLLRKVLTEYGTMKQFLEPAYDDADWVSNRFAELLPLGREAQQRLLETDDPQERLRVIAPLVEAR